MCRACRHPQCKPVEGSDLCAYCEDQIPCPVLKSVQVPPRPLPPHKPAPPVSPPHVKAEPVAKLCECGCGTDISGSAWKFVRGHKTKQEVERATPKVLPKPDTPPTNGHMPMLLPLEDGHWFQAYGRRMTIGAYDRLIAQLDAAPIPYRGEIEFATKQQLQATRRALEKACRGSKVYRLHCSRHHEKPNLLGIFKEARS